MANTCLLPYVSYTIWSSLRSTYLLRKIPGPSAPSWLWGCDWDMHKTPPGLRYLEWRARYGDIVKFKGALNRNILAISDRRAVKYILEEHVFDFPKPQGVREWFRSLVGDGVLVVEEKAAHARQRKLFAPALNPDAVKPLLPVFHSLASKMVDGLMDRATESTFPFIEEDLQWWTNRLSLDAIGLAGFSYDFHSLSGNSNPLAMSLEALTNTADNFGSFVMKALLFSFPSILKIPSQKGRYISQTRAELGKVALDMWTCAKDSNETINRTLMSMMMEAEGAEIISNEEIAAQLCTLVQAGYETVGCQMAWILFEIARCSDTQELLRKEISSIPEPTYEDIIQKMPLLDAILKESLRLHPPVFELTHVAAFDTVVPITGPLCKKSDLTITIPRGTIIHIPVNVLQTEQEIWGDDAAVFKPQRWLDLGNSVEGTDRQKSLFAFRLEIIPDKPIEPFWSFVVRTRVRGQARSTLPLRLLKL
ncbi:hypothetical protein Clacol_008216 [Clathrus columnatus]|uniref:Cytochrome P450 n=1 Tax=Clathrus columnatus TaxID=1419009 RepID=A0AAV5AML4_9AGAM|nr:hypothetical protein Clacol_008216 [Clathrus columnatus]